MPGGMTFRKDCLDCGRSFLTPDRKARLCPRCVGMGQKKDRPEKSKTSGHSSKPLEAVKIPVEKLSSRGSAGNIQSQILEKGNTKETQAETTSSLVRAGIAGKSETALTVAEQRPGTEKPQIVLTEAQQQEIINRYQAYVHKIERPEKGRRKTIAAEFELPYQVVVLVLRGWNKSQGEELSREEKFLLEKSYFSFLEKERTLGQIKERICRETGFSPWAVDRYLDILHDGEEKLQNVPEVTLEQRTVILTEYQKYLSGSSPPDLSLHAWIAEKTGVNPKQVHKILVFYRLSRFRESFVKGF